MHHPHPFRAGLRERRSRPGHHRFRAGRRPKLEIEENCRIADLKAFVMKAREESDKRTGAAKQREAKKEMERMAGQRY